MTHEAQIAILHAEIERLLLENWQLKGALGYPVPAAIPESTEFRCGLCAARAQVDHGGAYNRQYGNSPLSMPAKAKILD